MSYAKIRPRRSTKAEWEVINPILWEGELGIEYPDTGIGTGPCKFKIGDGINAWLDLAYAFDGATISSINGGSVTEYMTITLRSGTTEEWEALNPVLKLGEPVFDVTKGAIKVGDGVTAFKDLKYIGSNIKTDTGDYDFGDLDNPSSELPEESVDFNYGDLDLGEVPIEPSGGNCNCPVYTDEEIQEMIEEVIGTASGGGSSGGSSSEPAYTDEEIQEAIDGILGGS